MTKHLFTETITAQQTNATTPTDADRLAAIELLLQHLVFLLDAEGALRIPMVERWLNTCTAAMYRSGSVPAAEVAALARLQGLVLQ